jgi:hypothetical protein
MISKRSRWCLLLPLLVLACPEPSEEELPGFGDGHCEFWLGAQSSGTLSTSTLDEVSGMAASHRFFDTLWVHNDGGNSAALQAIDGSGQSLGSWSVLGAENRDWEDLATGPCTAAGQPCTCLYLADVGDNDGEREQALVYRLPEPDVGSGSSGGQITEREELWFTYPDGPHDAEALLVHPETGEVLVVTKAGVGETLTGVFAFPDAPPEPRAEADPVTLELVGWLDLADLNAQQDAVTGGAVSPLGHRAVLRTDEDALIFDVPDGGTLADAFDEAPRFAPTPDEDGEAVTFSADGRTLFMVGEGVSGVDAPRPTLWQVRCNSFEEVAEGGPDPLVECGD